MTSDKDMQQIELLTEELADLDVQLKAGEIDAETAEVLRVRYLTELAAVIDRRTAGDESATVATTEAPAVRRMSRRAVAGTVVVAVAIVVIGISAAISLTSGQTSGVEGLVQDVLGGEARDLSEVSNEEMEVVVAANPGVVPMRLALARRYLEGGEFNKALDHYFVILEVEQNPEALANVGWMTHVSGHSDVAAEYVEAALERDPTSLVAHWYLGNIYMSLDRGDEAVVHLTIVATTDSVPEEVRDSALELIRRIEGSGG